MAEDTKEKDPTPPPAPKVPSRESLVAHLATAEKNTLALVGTNLFNPYLYVKRNIKPLQDELSKAEAISSELAAKILAVKAAVLPAKAVV
jgi:hypothetical protein